MPKKALALVESPEHVCCRYRIRAFEPALTESGWSLDLRGCAGVRGLARLRLWNSAAGFDTVILQRKLLPWWELRWLRRQSCRLIFDFDDAVLYRDSNDPRGPHCPRRRVRFQNTVRSADLVIAGNRFLADRAIEVGANPSRVIVIPTVVQTASALPQRELSRPDGDLRLCWIGSSSTLKGLERRASLWEQLHQAVPGVCLRVVCDRFPEFGSLPIERIPWSESVEREALETSDVGVSWIPDELWSRGKCGLKLLQYQAAGLPTIANPVGVHPEMIQHGQNGFLAESDEEWISAIRQLANDPQLRKLMRRAAWDSVVKNYSIKAWSSSFVAALESSSVLAATA